MKKRFRGANFFNSPELAERGERKMKFINKKERRAEILAVLNI